MAEALTPGGTAQLREGGMKIEGRMTNGKRDRLDQIEELLRMTAAQTAENAKQIAANSKELSAFSKEFRADLAKSRKEHDREMREIRGLFKQMIRRIAA
jgi:hypothetical protein